jgi:AcrR family transcriptional regulator
LSIVIEAPAQARPKRTVRAAAETRQHILDVTERLFYWDGIRATGVDTITREAGVAPTTLYRLFASKDDLVAAYVERYAAGYRQWIEELTGAAELSPRDRILAVFDGLAENTGPHSFRGCPFLMALAEYPDAESAAHVSAQAVKAWVRDKLLELAGQLPGLDRKSRHAVADRLALVVEGIYASTAALGADGPAKSARSLAALVIDSAAERH